MPKCFGATLHEESDHSGLGASQTCRNIFWSRWVQDEDSGLNSSYKELGIKARRKYTKMYKKNKMHKVFPNAREASHC